MHPEVPVPNEARQVNNAELVEASTKEIRQILKALELFFKLENGRYSKLLEPAFSQQGQIFEDLTEIEKYFETKGKMRNKEEIIENFLLNGHGSYNQLFRLYHFLNDYCDQSEIQDESVWGEMLKASADFRTAFESLDKQLQNWGINFHKITLLKSVPENLDHDVQMGAPYIFRLGENNKVFGKTFNVDTWHTSFPSKTVFDVSTIGYETSNFNGTNWAAKSMPSKIWRKEI